MKRTLIAGVGYSNLTDLSVGPIVAAELRSESWPSHVDVLDLSIGPIAAVHWLNEAKPRYERMIVVTAADRGDREASIRCYRWDGRLPPDEEIQARVAESVTGVIDPDNLLIVTEKFGALPAEVFVIEVQPVGTEFGLTPTEGVRALLPEVKRLARHYAEGLA